MCGGYELDADPEALAHAFRVDRVQLELPLPGWPEGSERYPRQLGLIVAVRRGAEGEREERVLGPARFGLVPPSSQGTPRNDKLYNARSETVHERPLFRGAFERRRCLVPVTAFYEWQRVSGKSRRVAFALSDHAPFALAGIWQPYTRPDGTKAVSFAILTTAPNALIAPIHERMPVVLEASAQTLWLSRGADPEALRARLVPAPEGLLRALPG
jgi:putative SOS response-associated peptidase YedK